MTAAQGQAQLAALERIQFRYRELVTARWNPAHALDAALVGITSIALPIIDREGRSYGLAASLLQHEREINGHEHHGVPTKVSTGAWEVPKTGHKCEPETFGDNKTESMHVGGCWQCNDERSKSEPHDSHGHCTVFATDPADLPDTPKEPSSDDDVVEIVALPSEADEETDFAASEAAGKAEFPIIKSMIDGILDTMLREQRDLREAHRAGRLCANPGCAEPLPAGRPKYCSDQCADAARQRRHRSRP